MPVFIVLFFTVFTGLLAFAQHNTSRSLISIVTPHFETEPVSSEGDAADDTALWIHPTDPRRSLIVATDKKAGLLFYTLEGRRVLEAQVGQINNIDARAGVPFAQNQITLLAGTNRTLNSIALFTVYPKNLQLISLGQFRLSYVPYGICLAGPNLHGEVSAFITTKEGLIDHWALKAENQTFKIRHIGSWQVSGKTEGCVADEGTEQLFVAEEAVGLWRFDLQNPRQAPILVEGVTPHGKLVADVEGVAIYRGMNSPSYLVVSSQGDNSFHIYDLVGLKSRGAFQIGASKTIDSVSDTDGIEILGGGLVDLFPQGLFIAQDGLNENPSSTPLNQNFKAVDWAQIRSSLHLD